MNKLAIIFTTIYAFATLIFFGFYLSTGYDVISVVLGGLLAVLPVPLWLMLSLLIDRKEPEPKWMLVGAFIWGSSIAAAFALLFNSISSRFISDGLVAILSAPVSEEIGKGSLLIIFYYFMREQINGIRDGLVYAAVVGLGFAMTENMVYYAKAFQEGFSEGFSTFLVRGLATPYLHPIFTSLTGIGVGLAAKKEESNRVIYEGLLFAILAHAVWNGLAILLGK